MKGIFSEFLDGIASLGAWVLGHIRGLGHAVFFLGQLLASLPSVFSRFGLFIRQLFMIGVLSTPIVAVAGLFVGMVISFQGYRTLSQFGTESSLGILVALSILRELGPVVSALLFAGRAGSAITSEIGLMKTTEQLSSMEIMAVRPVEYVFVPRFLAALLGLPLLAILFSSIAILGGWLVGVVHLGVDNGSYWGSMQAGVDFFDDVFLGVITKSVVFAFLIAAIAIYQGNACNPTSQGISEATTKTVVLSSLAVLMADFLLTTLFFGI